MQSKERMPKKWVMVRLSALGDVVLTTGVLRRLFETRGWRFVVLTKKGMESVFENHPAVDEVITLEQGQLSFPHSLAVFNAISKKYKGYGLLDFHCTLRTSFLKMLWCGPVRSYNKLALERRIFMLSGKRFFENKLLEHNVAQRYFAAIETPPSPQELLPFISLLPREQDAARAALACAGIDTAKPFVAIHPYAAHTQKTWPPKRWNELFKVLKEQKIPFIILGCSKESPFNKIGAGDFTNTTSIRETCALLSLARALVTPDSGPMHLAVAVGTPVLALFGPTTKHWGFFPCNSKSIILEADCPGRPYSLHGTSSSPLADNCMEEVSVSCVLSHLRDLLF